MAGVHQSGVEVLLGVVDRLIEAPSGAAVAALAEGGSVFMPLAQTFWAERFGMVTDQFGIPWMINCDKPA